MAGKNSAGKNSVPFLKKAGKILSRNSGQNFSHKSFSRQKFSPPRYRNMQFTLSYLIILVCLSLAFSHIPSIPRLSEPRGSVTPGSHVKSPSKKTSTYPAQNQSVTFEKKTSHPPGGGAARLSRGMISSR